MKQYISKTFANSLLKNRAGKLVNYAKLRVPKTLSIKQNYVKAAKLI